MAWNYPTPATLSKYLAGEASGNANNDEQPEPVPVDDEFARMLAEIESLSEEDAKAALDDQAG